MTTVTADPTDTRPTPPRRATKPYTLSFTGQLRSEWTKFWSLRSTWMLMVIAASLSVLVIVITIGEVAGFSDTMGLDPISDTLFGHSLAATLVGLLGVLFVTNEFASGSIRSTLAAAPSRVGLLRNKVIVFASLTGVVFGLAVLGQFLYVQTQLGDHALAVSLTDDGVIRALAGITFGVVYWGVMGLALGALIRNTAGGFILFIVTFALLPDLVHMLPWQNSVDIIPYLPGQTAQPLTHLNPDESGLSLGTAALLCVGWMALFLSAAAACLKRRDV